MIRLVLSFAAAAAAAGLASCHRQEPPAAGTPPALLAEAAEAGHLLQVGSIVITQADLDHQLKERSSGRNDEETRKKALDALVGEAQTAQAALDAGLAADPVVRAGVARLLASRLREKTLSPKLKALSKPIPEDRLRELYAAGESSFRSGEKRETAVLWLNPGRDPERTKQYEEKLEAARAWLLRNGDLKDRPADGFSVLGVDHSEHPASRYKGGVLGWLEQQGGMDPWTKVVAEIVFSLKESGEVSPVVTRPEGVFLVRCMAVKPAVLRSFEIVRPELEQMERNRLRQEAEADFISSIRTKYPAPSIIPPTR